MPCKQIVASSNPIRDHCQQGHIKSNTALWAKSPENLGVQSWTGVTWYNKQHQYFSILYIQQVVNWIVYLNYIFIVKSETLIVQCRVVVRECACSTRGWVFKPCLGLTWNWYFITHIKPHVFTSTRNTSRGDESDSSVTGCKSIGIFKTVF